MKWTNEAENAIKKVPFFIRKKVRKKVEAYAGEKGRSSVTLSDVTELKQKFLSKGGMEKEIKGYEVCVCFGKDGCPNVANSGTRLALEIEQIMEKEDILSFLKENVKGDLKFHHEFRVTIADCPNACSRPQISDIGIIGTACPEITDEPCTLCRACVDTCQEDAIDLSSGSEAPELDAGRCIMCGKCISVCPSGTLAQGQKGFRVMVGGRLGRHPRLAMELPGLHTHDEVLILLRKCLEFYKTHSKNGRRFSHILASIDQITSV